MLITSRQSVVHCDHAALFHLVFALHVVGCAAVRGFVVESAAKEGESPVAAHCSQNAWSGLSQLVRCE